MTMRALTLTLSSIAELLMDRDNITFSEDVAQWQKDPANADVQRPGDDRAPAWGWLGKLHYHEKTGMVGIPQGMLGACLRAAATTIPHPTAKGKKSLKEVSQSGLLFTETLFPLYVQQPNTTRWTPILFPDLFAKLREEDDFATHVEVGRLAGIRVDVRRSRPQFNRSHVRVRPMFGPWRSVVQLTLTDDVLTDELVLQVFHFAGTYKGLGNWRPSAGRAGSYGTFQVTPGIAPELQEWVR
jgi:hypothetical protein